jgi:hypothetical protein
MDGIKFMGNELDYYARRILRLYEERGITRPAPRAFALRALEEAVELALACGATIRDAHDAVEDAFRSERVKHSERGYDDAVVEPPRAIASEVADVSLLLRCTALVVGEESLDDMIEEQANFKVTRLVAASKDGTLHFTKDGRFYRRPKL